MSNDYEVGYGKPPKHSRFKKGQSGNPKGRPKGSRNFATDVKQTLNHPVRLSEDGRPRTISTQQAALYRLREKALNGDVRALDRLLALAQTHNGEDLSTAATGLGDVDAEIVRRFTERQMRRAVSPPADALGDGETDAAGGDDTPAEHPGVAEEEDDDGWLK